MSEIYFHRDKFIVATGVGRNNLPDTDRPACRHKATGIILVDVGQLLQEYFGMLDGLSFDNKFNLCVSHEVLHEVLTQHMSSSVSYKLDALTVKYWNKGIDIGTNLEV